MTYQLEEPFFEEKGRITAQKEIGGDKTQMTFSSNGTFKGNIEVTNSGDFVTVSKGNKGTLAQGQGVVTTKDGSEKASYTSNSICSLLLLQKAIINFLDITIVAAICSIEALQNM